MRHYRSDQTAQRLMQDLRILVGAESLLRTFEDGESAVEVLTLTARRAESAAANARLLIEEARQRETERERLRGHFEGGDGGAG